MVPPRWGLVTSVLFATVPMPYEIKKTWLIFYVQVVDHRNDFNEEKID